MLGEQRLVSGYDRFAVLHRLENQSAGGLDSTHNLDHEIDLGVRDDRIGVGG